MGFCFCFFVFVFVLFVFVRFEGGRKSERSLHSLRYQRSILVSKIIWCGTRAKSKFR